MEVAAGSVRPVFAFHASRRLSFHAFDFSPECCEEIGIAQLRFVCRRFLFRRRRGRLPGTTITSVG
jgi:hypothetical protein